MNIKKSLLFLLTVVLVFSCKQDELLNQNTGAADLSLDISQYDNSNLGLYKGTFTTLDASERGILELNVLNNVPSKATLTLNSGSVLALQSTSVVKSNQDTNLTFVTINDDGQDFSFVLSVNKKGENLEINNALLGSSVSDILVSKETSKGPVVTIVGTWNCTECLPNMTGTAQTFNLVGSSGVSSFTPQVTLNSAVYNGNASQSAQTSFGGFDISEISGTFEIPQSADPTDVLDVAFIATHRYSSSGGDCSTITGFWNYDNRAQGNMASDGAGNCAPIPGNSIANPIPIVPNSAGTGCAVETVFNTNQEYTKSYLATVCRSGTTLGKDKFYSWTANEDTLFFIPGSGQPGFVVRDAVTGEEIVGACRVSGPTSGVRLSGWTIGQNLIIQVYDFYTADVEVGFCLAEWAISAGNTFETAVPAIVGAPGSGCAVPQAFSLGTGYTDSGLDSTCADANSDIDKFFTWTSTTNALFFTPGATGAPGIAIYTPAMEEITCLSLFSSGVVTGWTAGDDLVIQIFGNGGDVEFCLEENTFVPGPTFTLTPPCGGFLIDNGEALSYANDSSDTYLIDGGAFVPTINFTEFSVEAGWDYMKIYDGPDTDSPEITDGGDGQSGLFCCAFNAFTGTSLNGASISATGSTLTVIFSSDVTGTDAGFLGSITCVNPLTGETTGEQPTVTRISSNRKAIRQLTDEQREIKRRGSLNLPLNPDLEK